MSIISTVLSPITTTMSYVNSVVSVRTTEEAMKLRQASFNTSLASEVQEELKRGGFKDYNEVKQFIANL